ncbi:MAG: xanthine dehydrogenase family protein molybdopterin-binding subunit, partial [Acetobacteraceae bacterium]
MEKFGNAWSGRVEDQRLLRGAGRYTDDTARPGGLHGVVLRSPHAAARIVSVDVAPALTLPGVVAAYTARDLAADGIGAMPCPVELPNRDGTPRQDPPHPVLADGMVRHVGDPVAFVVARTLQAAADGAEAIGVEYEVADPVIDLLGAMEDGQKLIWPDARHNICFDWEIGDRARCDALFAGAAHVIRRRIVNNRVVVASMEPRAAAAEYDAGTERWTLTTNTQGVWLVRDLLAASVFKVDPARIRVITEDVGGGFGMKAFLYAEHALTCYAARKLGQPVKWTSGRSEAFLSDTQGRDNITFGELALDANGRFLALRSRNIANMGAYLSTYGPYIPTLAGSKVLPSVYRFEAVYLNVLGVFTNTVPVDAYRGAGRPESNYLVERLVDAAARELGIDAVELRRRNMVTPAEMPYRTPVGETYDCGEFARVMDVALARIDRAGFAARRAEAAKRNRCRGLGFAYYLESTMGAPEERAEIRFAQDG